MTISSRLMSCVAVVSPFPPLHLRSRSPFFFFPSHSLVGRREAEPVSLFILFFTSPPMAAVCGWKQTNQRDKPRERGGQVTEEEEEEEATLNDTTTDGSRKQMSFVCRQSLVLGVGSSPPLPISFRPYTSGTSPPAYRPAVQGREK